MDVYIQNLSTRKSYKTYNEIANKQQIVQWCCCDCGQSYGTIIFHDRVLKLFNQEDDISRLKYYSSIIYNTSHADSNSNYQVLSCLTPPPLIREVPDYFEPQFVANDADLEPEQEEQEQEQIPGTESSSRGRNNSVDTEVSNMSLGGHGSTTSAATPVIIRTSEDGLNDSVDASVKVVENFPKPKPFNEFNDNDNDNDHDMSQYLIMTPERFVCSRCDHMMCPYCPKLRCQDLS